MTRQLAEAPPLVSPAPRRPWPRWAGAAAMAVGLGLSIFVLYFVTYPLQHASLPAGFDPPYYVYRAQHLIADGLGTGTLASRPGYPILSALLGGLTGLSQLDMTIVLSMVLVAVLALTVGAFAANGIDRSRLGWALTVAAAGVVVGATQLVGENLANILNIALEIAALIPLAVAVAGEHPGIGLGAAVALIVASGISHWIFLPVFLGVLAVAALLALRPSLERWRAGTPLWRTESGMIASAGLAAAGIMAVVIATVLRAPFRTIEIAQDSVLFRKKIRTDAVRLMVPAALALIGVRWIPSARKRADAGDARTTFSFRMLTAWTWTMGVALALAIATWFLPPTRFLAHLVALSGAVAVGVLLTEGVRWMSERLPVNTLAARVVPTLFVGVALILLSLPGLIRWYRYPVLMDSQVLAEARQAGTYVAQLPPGEPVVFLTDYFGAKPGAYSTVLIDRTIRIAMPAHRDAEVFVFPGRLDDLLAGRRTPPPNSRVDPTSVPGNPADRITRPFWEDVRGVLPGDPPILVLRATGAEQFDDAMARGATELTPGVALVRGPAPGPIPPAPRTGREGGVTLWWGVWWGLVVLLILWVTGAGWTRVVLGSAAAPEVFLSLAPAVGAAALILGGLVAAAVGVGLGPAEAVATSAVVAVTGWVMALVAGLRRPR